MGTAAIQAVTAGHGTESTGGRTMINYDAVWQQLENNAGHTFTTTRGLKFTYSVIGHEMKISRKEKSITYSTVCLALDNAELLNYSVKGPKALKVFGASYLYPVLLDLGIIHVPDKGARKAARKSALAGSEDAAHEAASAGRRNDVREAASAGGRNGVHEAALTGGKSGARKRPKLTLADLQIVRGSAAAVGTAEHDVVSGSNSAAESHVPKVSIIIPCYNAAKPWLRPSSDDPDMKVQVTGADGKPRTILHRCIDSVLGQDFKDFELILMDDGSQDETGAILDAYAAEDPRVTAVHKPNSGVSSTRNLALDLAKGEYVQFLDADDWIIPEATALFVHTLEDLHCDMVIADFYRVVGEHAAPKGDIGSGEVLTRQGYADEMMKNPADFYYGVIWNKFFRRSIIEKFHLRMDEDLNWCEDFIFVLEYVLHCDRIAPLRVPLYYYVKTDGSLVETQSAGITSFVRMKMNVIEYYNEFYKQTYDGLDYALRRPRIIGFLVAAAGDGTAFGFAPSTKKLADVMDDGLYEGRSGK